MADMRGRRLCYQMRLGTPWEDIHLRDGADTRHRLGQHNLTRRKGNILVITEAEALYAYLLRRT